MGLCVKDVSGGGLLKKKSAKTDIVTVTKTQDMLGISETLALLSDIRSLIEAARMRVSTTANVEMVLLYWHIGHRILKDILGKERADYGKQIVQTLSGKLTLEYGRGFTRTNLFNMIRCAEVFPDREIVHALSGQLSWMCRIERWSTRTLQRRDSGRYHLRLIFDKEMWG